MLPHRAHSVTNVACGSNPEVSNGHKNVGFRGQSGSRFRATGGLFVAISGPKNGCEKFEIFQKSAGRGREAVAVYGNPFHSVQPVLDTGQKDQFNRL